MASKKKLRREIRRQRKAIRACEKEIRMQKLYIDSVDHSNEQWKAICSRKDLRIWDLEKEERGIENNDNDTIRELTDMPDWYQKEHFVVMFRLIRKRTMLAIDDHMKLKPVMTLIYHHYLEPSPVFPPCHPYVKMPGGVFIVSELGLEMFALAEKTKPRSMSTNANA